MKMLAFVESQMNSVAPNVSAIVGTTIAAKLIGAAGGLDKLAELPSTVVQILGSKKKTLGGMSTTSQVMHAGVMKDADIIQNTPPAFRSKILRLVRCRANYAPAACTAPPHSLHADQSTPSSYGRTFPIWQVAGKVTLAARVDAFQDRGDGAVGQRFRDEIEVRHVAPPSTWQSPPILPSTWQLRSTRHPRVSTTSFHVAGARDEAAGAAAAQGRATTARPAGVLGQASGRPATPKDEGADDRSGARWECGPHHARRTTPSS